MFKFNSKNPYFLLSLLLLLMSTFLLNTTAQAHTIGVSQGKYKLLNINNESHVQTELFFARPELNSFLNLDTNADNTLTEEELKTKYIILQKSIIDTLHINDDTGQRCIGKLNDAILVEADGIQLNAYFFCNSTNQVSIKLDFLANLSRGHRHVITSQFSTEKSSQNVAYLGKPSFKIISNSGSDPENNNTESFFTFGLEHILTGYDHLLFLFALILMPISLKQVLFSITAFTLAHSITLGISVLGFLVPSSGVIEPLIALSIAYVGVENFIIKNFNKRWILTFLFGLIHGFGFAGALHDISLSTDHLPWVLLNFNLGVETGQILVILMAFPLLYWLRKNLWFNSSGIAALNIGLVLIGSYWFLDRGNLIVI